MKTKWNWGKGWAVLLVLALAGCTGVGDSGASPAFSGRVGRIHTGIIASYAGGEEKQENYTKEDLELALSFQTQGYEKLTVAEFNRKVMDWEQEDAYHKTEAAFERLSATLEEEHKDRAFIVGPLFQSWTECEKKHYNACERNASPWYTGEAAVITTGQVFGDEVTLTEARADFGFSYHIAEEAKVTVEEREQAFQKITKGLEAFMGKQDRKALEQQKTMEKTVTQELERLLKEAKGTVEWDGESHLYYWWNQNFDESSEQSVSVMESGTAVSQAGGSYTQEQYQLALKTFQPEGYEKMSVAEFNRKINGIFAEVREQEAQEKAWLALDQVQCNIKESDPNYLFFQETIPAALEEYEAKIQELGTGKTVDPARYATASLEQTEDVYGDKVSVGMGDANYDFTYRIVQPEQLTVEGRARFFAAVREEGKKLLQSMLEKGNLEESEVTAKFQAGMEKAGKNADTPEIIFTGCETSYCGVWSYR